MENGKIEIVCFKWGGWGQPFGFEYIFRLHNMLKRYLSIPFNFHVFSDKRMGVLSDVNLHLIPDFIMKYYKLNFPKFYVYSSLHGITGRVIMIDLDTIITGSLDEMFSYDGDWCGIKPMRPGRTHIGGGLVSFEHSKFTWLWEEMKNNLDYFIDKYKGKERLVYQELMREYPDRWQDLYPGQLVGYKRGVRKVGGLNSDVRFVAFHGNPRPHEIRNEQWMREYWK